MDAKTRLSKATHIRRSERERVIAAGSALSSYGTSSAAPPGCHSTDEPLLLCEEDSVAPTRSHPPACDGEPSLLRRALTGSSILALFVLGVSMGNNSRQALNDAEQRAPAAKTGAMWQVSYVCTV